MRILAILDLLVAILGRFSRDRKRLVVKQDFATLTRPPGKLFSAEDKLTVPDIRRSYNFTVTNDAELPVSNEF